MGKRKVLLAVIFIMATMLIGCSGSAYKYADSGSYKCGDAQIAENIEFIDVDWRAGEVQVEHYDKNEISISEGSNMDLTDNIRLHYLVKDNKLVVKYCASGEDSSLINLKKKLTIKVPRNISLDKISITTASADIVTDMLTAENVVFKSASGDLSIVVENSPNVSVVTASGNIDANIEAADKVSVETASGTMDIIVKNINAVELTSASGDMTIKQKGETKTFIAESASGKIELKANNIAHPEVNTASGNMKLKFKSTPDVIDIRSTSGKVNLQLPEDSEFVTSIKSASGNFDCDFDDVTRNGKNYTKGSGKCDINISTTSGDMKLKPYEEDDE